MQLNYRLAQDSDLQAVYDLYMDPASNGYLTYDRVPIEAFTSIFSGILREQNLFVTTINDGVVATYRLIRKTHRQSHILYLGGFTVSNAMKGKGIGHEILHHIKREARVNNFERIELTVDTENRAAINLYRKVGFEIEGKLRNNYRLASTGRLYDEYVMALLLS